MKDKGTLNARHLSQWRSGIRAHLRPFFSAMGRPSIDPELMIWTLLVGYCIGIRSERRLCEEVHINLAYRWSRLRLSWRGQGERRGRE